MKVPFAPPRMDQRVIDEVADTLLSGWITTGPKTKKFEKLLTAYCNVPNVLALNSATAGLEIMLRWFGVKEGDEVILPAYTYSATANVVIHCGAKPVFVDVGDDFNNLPSEIENAINQNKHVVESAVVGYPHDIKGQGIYAFIICHEMPENPTYMRDAIIETIVAEIGRIAKPDKIQFVSGLPKTRSGKIMRRILRKVAEGDTSSLGDTSTLLDPNVVDEIIAGAIA